MYTAAHYKSSIYKTSQNLLDGQESAAARTHWTIRRFRQASQLRQTYVPSRLAAARQGVRPITTHELRLEHIRRTWETAANYSHPESGIRVFVLLHHTASELSDGLALLARPES